MVQLLLYSKYITQSRFTAFIDIFTWNKDLKQKNLFKHVRASLVLYKASKNLHSAYNSHKNVILRHCKRVFPPESSWRGRFLTVDKGLLWAVFWCALNGARLWNVSPQVEHWYSRWAARRSWTCFTCRFRCELLWNDLSHLSHWCGFSS